MKFKDCDYLSGKNNDGDFYAYFGQLEKKEYDGLGLLYWDHPSFFLGQFKKGDKNGPGLYRSQNGNMTFGLYEGWDNNGPTVAVTKDSSQIVFSVEKGKMKKFFFVIEPGEYLKKYSFDGKNSKFIKEIKKVKMPSNMPTFDIPTDFTELGNGDFEENSGKNSNGSKWKSFEEQVRQGKDYLDLTIYDSGETYLGVRNKGAMQGLGASILSSGVWNVGYFEESTLNGIYFLVINDDYYGVGFDIKNKTYLIVIGPDGDLFYSVGKDEPVVVNLLDDDDDDTDDEDEEPKSRRGSSKHDEDDEEEITDTKDVDFKKKLDKAILEKGKTDSKDKFTYFGQITSRGVWNGYGLLFWDHPAFYVGEFRNGTKKGIGLARNQNGKLTFSTYKDWDVLGPSVEINKGSSQIAFAMNGGKYNNYYFLIEPGETIKKCRINNKGKPEILYEYEDIVITSKMPDVDFYVNLNKIDTSDISRNTGEEYDSYDNFTSKLKQNFDLSFFKSGEEFIGTRKNGKLDGLSYSKIGTSYRITQYSNGDPDGSYFIRFDDGSFGVSFQLKDKYPYISLNKDGVLDYFDGNETYHVCFQNDRIDDVDFGEDDSKDDECDDDEDTETDSRDDKDNSDDVKDPDDIQSLVKEVKHDATIVNYESGTTQDKKTKFHYFGQYNGKVWNGVGMIYWDHPSMYIGQFREGHKSGIGLYRYDDNTMRFTYYQDNEGYGPYIDVEGEVVKLYPNSKKNGYVYVIEAGECLKEYEIDGKKLSLVREFEHIVLPKDIQIGEFVCNLTKCGNYEMEKIVAKDKSWSSFQETGVPNGKKFFDATSFKNNEFDLCVRSNTENNAQYDGVAFVSTKGQIEIKEYEKGEEINQSFLYCFDEFLTVCFKDKSDKYYLLHLNENGVYINKEEGPIGSNDDETTSSGHHRKDDDDEEREDAHSSHSGHHDEDEDENPKSTKRKHKEDHHDDTDPEEELNKLVGLGNVKTQLNRIKAYLKKNSGEIDLHMCFYGNPGTGKTVVARLVARILHKINVLPTDHLVETSRDGLVGQYIGETGVKTQKIIDDAMGGVLFIDEAYNLAKKGDEKDFGKEAVGTLIKEMEDKRGKFCVILAGYRDEMEEMISTNPGFKSRIQFKIDFPNYNREEMRQIANMMLASKKYTLSNRAFEKMLNILEEYSKTRDFANAREVRNIINQLIFIQNARTEDDADNREINEGDVNTYMEERGMNFVSEEDHSFLTVNYRAIRKYSDNFDEANYKFDQRKLEECAVYLHNNEGDSSGVLISSDGLIATCAHCVSKKCVTKASVIYISHNGKKIIEESDTEIIDIDYDNDVAVIRAVNFNNMTEFHPLEKEGAEPIKPLTEIVMAGYPFGGSRLANISINKGLVQSINFDNRSAKRSELVLVDLSGKGGNSGSGVLDAKTGRVVGIFSGSLMQPLGNTDSVEEINFFRPIKFVWKILKHHSD